MLPFFFAGCREERERKRIMLFLLMQSKPLLLHFYGGYFLLVVSVHAKIRTSNNIFQKRLVRLILFGNFAK
jgi:hypothetical protein